MLHRRISVAKSLDAGALMHPLSIGVVLFTVGSLNQQLQNITEESR